MNINLSELVVSNLIGLVVGLATSFFSWWVLFHAIVPKIVFSNAISKSPRKNRPGHSYRIKFSNDGSRSIIGVEVVARLTFKWEGSTTWTGLYIPLSSDGDCKYEVPKLDAGRNRILTLWINCVESFKTNHRYPDAFRAKAESRGLTLEDVLGLGVVAKLQVFVSGYDSFSGARKVFSSVEYRTADIVAGRFRRLDVSTEQSPEAEAAETMHNGEGSGDVA